MQNIKEKCKLIPQGTLRYESLVVKQSSHPQVFSFFQDSISRTIERDAFLKSVMFNREFRGRFAKVLSEADKRCFSFANTEAIIGDYKEKYSDALN